MANANDEIIRRVQSGQLTPQQADVLFTKAGINVAAGGGARSNALNSDPAANQRLLDMITGENAMPVGVEPIHTYERQALMGMGDPSSIADRGYNPMSSTFLQNANMYAGKADSALQNGMRGFDANEVQQYFNPAQEAVTNRATSRLSENAKKLQQDMVGRLSNRGSATMGDLYGAQQMGDIQKELVSKTGDIEAQGAYQNWTDAVANMMQTRNNSLQAGNTYAGMVNPMTSAATGAQGITNSAFTTGLAGLQAQQGAGRRIQGFNQGVADISMGNYLGRNDFQNNLGNTAFSTFNTLNSPSANIGQTQQVQPNTGAQIGSALGGLAGASGLTSGIGNFSAVGDYGPQQQNWVGQGLSAFGINL
jgi:hypothetical protein